VQDCTRMAKFMTAYACRWCPFEFTIYRTKDHYVIKFVSDLRQVGGFLRILRFPPPIKLTAMIYM
jgi:hypothetical protein